MIRTVTIGAVVGLAMLSTGCPGTGGGNGGDGVGDGSEFEARLDGDQEVPVVITDASGVGGLTLSQDETEITYLFTASGLSGPVTGAHFHLGGPGEDGDIVIDISADVSQVDDEVVIEGGAAADAAFVTALRAGDIYVNIHTEQNPGGEIRGQLEEAP